MAATLLKEDLPVTLRCLGAAPPLDNAPDWIHRFDNPYLHGLYAPTVQELDTASLPVTGELPPDLSGAYFRNGPNPMYEPPGRYHPFDGDGMLHGVYFSGGRASYRNRFILTAALRQEHAVGHALYPGVMGAFDRSLSRSGIKDTANTDVFFYNGELQALWYNAGEPYRVDSSDLGTHGFSELRGRSARHMSAHSKVDPATGELLFFDYADEPPYLTYGVADAGGRLAHQVEIDLPGPRLPHDLGFTSNYTILHDLPFFHDPEVLRRHNVRALSFHRDLPARFGIIPRHGSASEIRWFDCEPCYILHVSNCWEAGDWIVMDGCRSVNPMPSARGDDGALSHMLAYMRLEANNYRWRFNLRTGEVREGDIDDLNTEFNRVSPRILGRESRYAYHQRIPLASEGGHTLRFTGLVKYDNDTGTRWQYAYGPGVYGSEAVFAPRANAERNTREDDGYVVTIVTDTRDWQSSALVFDARDIESGPVASVALPQRVPAGFHATWVTAEQLESRKQHWSA
jgi:carotenoid cleavage dioxygenase-like enzyme